MNMISSSILSNPSHFHHDGAAYCILWGQPWRSLPGKRLFAPLPGDRASLRTIGGISPNWVPVLGDPAPGLLFSPTHCCLSPCTTQRSICPCHATSTLPKGCICAAAAAAHLSFYLCFSLNVQQPDLGSPLSQIICMFTQK